MNELDAGAVIGNDDTYMAHHPLLRVGAGEEDEVARPGLLQWNGGALIGKIYRRAWYLYLEVVEDIVDKARAIEPGAGGHAAKLVFGTQLGFGEGNDLFAHGRIACGRGGCIGHGVDLRGHVTAVCW